MLITLTIIMIEVKCADQRIAQRVTEEVEYEQVRAIYSSVDSPGSRLAAAYGSAATVAFCLLVVGSNIPGPLLPIYRDRLDLSTVTVTALFAAYLVGLVATFTVVARTRLPAYSTHMLAAAVAVCFAGDLALLVGVDTVAWLFVGRVLVGVSVGLGTGAAATIVLATRGERGRAIAATGTLLGSFLGLLLAAVVADILPGPTTTVYYIHLALLALAAVALAVTHARSRDTVPHLIRGSVDEPTGFPVAEAHSPRVHSPRVRFAGFALGTAGWAIGGVVVGLLPTVVTDMTGSGSILVTALGPIVLIGVACIAPRIIAPLRSPVSACAIGAGAVLCFLGVWMSSLPTIIVCCVVWGVGQGFAYANGLRIVTAGLQPVDQGRIASQYASIAYGFTSVLSVSTGFVVSAFGMVTGLGYAAVVFVALTCTTLSLGYRRWPD
ncbi:MFS transporter [Gordonia sp. (in: high G+C Gram-positive bacteria)]|uniref:MFS transporter n=1 Tax=Gordonia sp. (in: high G+C Gram-positive bacteria) TaxID=84139 RepID=UPI003F9B78ED